METVRGTTGSGAKARELTVRMLEGEPALHLWIHSPGAANGGWDIRVKPEELLAALGRVGFRPRPTGEPDATASGPAVPPEVPELPRRLANYFTAGNWDRALARYALFAEESGWSIPHKLEMYAWAKTAFQSDSPRPDRLAAFTSIYDSLRGYWQVFRPGRATLTAEQIFDMLGERCTPVSRRAGLTLAAYASGTGAEVVTHAAEDLRVMKPLQSGEFPTMAVSKFLHFFNPSLFPIYDRALVWNEVFDAFGDDYATFCTSAGLPAWPDAAGAGFYQNYVAWAASVVQQADPNLMEGFAAWFAGQVAGEDDPAGVLRDVIRYYATAFEFIAIGAAKLLSDA